MSTTKLSVACESHPIANGTLASLFGKQTCSACLASCPTSSMCRAHYIQGLGQCCVKDCTNKATNRYKSLVPLVHQVAFACLIDNHRNLKKGAKRPIKEGLHDQLHKVCMEHWNLVDQQTKSNEGKKKGKRKKKDTKTKGKKRRRNRYPRFNTDEMIE